MKTHRSFGIATIQTTRLPIATFLCLLTLAAPLQASTDAWEWTIPQRYQEARPFDATGLAMVRLAGKWGLIDKTGKQILPCSYDEITPYPKEACFAIRSGSLWGLADSTGRVLLRPEWDAVQPLVRNFIPVKRFGKWGYADASGKLVIPCAWDDAWRFSPAGTAVVTKGIGPEKKRGFIDRTGRIITAPVWDGAVNHVAEGLGAVRRGEFWAFVDKNGKLLGEPEWKFWWKTLRADLGFLPVWKDNKWGAAGLDGKILIPPEWESMAPGKDGVLFANPGAEAIFVGKNGKTLFTTGPWESVSGNSAPDPLREPVGFSEGFLAVQSGAKWGLISETGQTVISPAWDFLCEVHEGLVFVINHKDTESRGQFLKSDGTPAFETPEGVGFNWAGDDPRFRDGFVTGWKTDDLGYSSRVALDREGNLTTPRETPWLPEGLSITGHRIDFVSRNGRFGQVRNIAGPDGKTLMRDISMELASLADPFPYPGPPRYGFVSSEGKILAAPAWEKAEPFDEHWVRVWKNDRAGLLDSRGYQVLAAEWDSVEPVGNNLVLGIKEDRIFPFDAKGAPLLPEDIAGAEYVDFYGNGFFVKSPREDGGTLWTLCDPGLGTPVAFPNANRVYWNRELAANSMLWIEERDSGQWSLVKRNGMPTGVTQVEQPVQWKMSADVFSKVADGPWEKIREFTLGFAPVKQNGKWGFIDTEGRIVIPPAWSRVEDFEDIGTKDKPLPLARVATGRRWGCMDAQGRIVIEPAWEWIGRFFEAGKGRYLAFAKRDGKWGCIDSKGEIVIEPVWTAAKGQDSRVFSNGLISLTIQEEGKPQPKTVKFRPDGTRVSSSVVALLPSGAEIVKSPNGKFGLSQASGKAILEPKWDHIVSVADDKVAAWTDTDGGIFDSRGRALFRDNPSYRIVRFNNPKNIVSRDIPIGALLIETPPLWGYATFHPPSKEGEAPEKSDISLR